MSHASRIRKTARRFLEKGWRFVPIPPNEKAPKTKGWQNLRIENSEIDEYFPHDSNIGLLTGEPSGGLTDVDLDCPEAIELASAFLPYTGRVHGRGSKPKSHRWYVVSPILSPEKYCDLDGTCLLELRSTGQQTVVPPSIHPSGEQIEWESRKRPARVDGAELRSAAARLAAATLFARHWPSKGNRNAAALALAGTLLRAGWEENEVEDFVVEVARTANDEEWASRKAVARTTRKRLDTDATATGRQRLTEIIGADVVGRACQWLGIETARAWSPRLRREIVPWPEPLAHEARFGLAGDVVRAIAPETEADQAGLLIQLLAGFGSLIGRSAYFEIGATRHHTNLFVSLVGQTAKARKGTAWSEIFKPLREVDPEWAQDHIVPGGLSSGEGLIWSVRDPEEEESSDDSQTEFDALGDPILKDESVADTKTDSKGDDRGIEDKRLLIVESEFASTLRVMRREANILSSVLRNSWDTGNLNNLTKNSPARATDAHISLIAHITQDELRRELTATDSANGFANRFLWVCVRRSKLLPFGGDLEISTFKRLVHQLQFAATAARQATRVMMSKQARKLWSAKYPMLAAEVPGLLGAIISRAEPQVLRLAMIYALLDCSRCIDYYHLEAALEVWRYCEDSARYIFGDALGDPVSDVILRELRRNENGSTRTEIRELFKRNRSEAEISRALSFLLEGAWVSCIQETTGGRPSERWFATR